MKPHGISVFISIEQDCVSQYLNLLFLGILGGLWGFTGDGSEQKWVQSRLLWGTDSALLTCQASSTQRTPATWRAHCGWKGYIWTGWGRFQKVSVQDKTEMNSFLLSFLIFLKDVFILCGLSVCLEYMDVHHTSGWCSQRQKEEVRSLTSCVADL